MTKKDLRQKSKAIDVDGNKLPFTPDQVNEIGKAITLNGNLVLMISSIENAYSVQIFVPPSPRLIEILKDAIKGIEGALE